MALPVPQVIGNTLRYLYSHSVGRNKQSGEFKRQHYLSWISEGIHVTARELMELGHHFTITTWPFDLVAGQSIYALRTGVAAQQAGATLSKDTLKDWENFGRPAALYVRDQADNEWVPVRLVDAVTAVDEGLSDTSSSWMPQATLEMQSQTVDGATWEGEPILRFPDPPTHSVTLGAKLLFHFLPSELDPETLNTFAPALPSFAFRFMRVVAEQQMYKAFGDIDALKILMHPQMGEYHMERQRLIENADKPLSDDPVYVDAGGYWSDRDWLGWGMLSGWGS